MFKPRDPEKRAAAEAERDQRKQAEGAARAEQAFYASPAGQARLAKQSGQTYFQIEMPVVDTSRTVTSLVSGDHTTKTRRPAGQGAVLTEIETEGWKLHTAGFVFHETGQVSRDKLMSSGQTVATTGQTIGIYLFAATAEPARDDEVWRGA